MGGRSAAPRAGTREVRGSHPGTLRAGIVGRPHGLDGAFRVRQARSALLLGGPTVLIDGSEREVLRRGGTDAAPILRLAGVDDRDAAASLGGAEIAVPRPPAPGLGAEEWYAEELEGCRVHDRELELGTVTRLLALPSCEVLEVAREGGGELLVPLVADAVLRVDVDGRRIDVDADFLGER